MTIDESGQPEAEQAAGRPGLAGATVGMAVGTTLSRVTGLARILATFYAVGGGPFGDAYNIANTTPNIVTDIVLGGVLSATFVPVFVDRLATRARRDAWRAISAVTTVTVVVLVTATVVFWFASPYIIDLYTVANNHAYVHQQQRVATTLLRWFVPQLACYGLIALFTALLNTQRKFAAPMFVPIANNVVVIAMLVWFHALVPDPSLATVSAQASHLALLGFGTTLGVVVQAALLLPSLARARLHLSFRWEPGHEALRTIVRLAGWTFGLVLANQIALVFILTLADPIAGAASAYTYAYAFFQLPYGIVAVSIMTAVTPSLSRHWALGQTAAFRHRMELGLRGMLSIILPAAVGLLLLAHPAASLVLGHGTGSVAAVNQTAAALALFALGLPGFCTFLYCVRVLQSMQDTRTAFHLYLLENSVNIVMAAALVRPLGVRGLALALSIAYSVAAVAALRLLGGRLGGLGGEFLARPLRRVGIATAVMAVVTVVVVNLSGTDTKAVLAARVVLAFLAGLVAYVATVFVLGARDEARHRRGPTPVASPDPPPADGFHDRLDGGPAVPPVRLLRPVAEEADATAPAPRRAYEEEDSDERYPRGDR